MKMFKSLSLAVALMGMAVQSHALLITAGVTPAVMIGDDSSQAVIDSKIAATVGSTIADYKDNTGGSEEGTFSGSYKTTYGIAGLLTESFEITYTGGSFISGGPIYLLVKDGTASPNWYLYDITGWDGKEKIQGQGFFPNQGGISHVAIYGNGGTTNVPDAGTTIALLGAALAGTSYLRRKLA